MPKIKYQVVVSVPRAGEFITTVTVDPDEYDEELDYTAIADEDIRNRLRVRLLPGELQRLRRAEKKRW